MQDLDKQLQGMKQDLTGLQVWNPDSTSYYQADGSDPYAYANGKHKADSFFNATGDADDLRQKVEDAKKERDSAKALVDSATTNLGNLISGINDLQAKYDALKPKSKKSKGEERDLASWTGELAQERSKRDATQSILDGRKVVLATKEENLTKANDALQRRIDEDAKKKDAEAKSASRAVLASQGLTPEAVEAKLLAEGKTKGKTRVAIVVGSILLIGIFGVMFLRKRD